FAFKLVTTDPDPKVGRPLGLAFSTEAHQASFIPLPDDDTAMTATLRAFQPLLENERITKIGHSVKCDIGYLLCYDIEVRGPIFDSMVAHSLIEPEMRHTLDYLAETRLGYCPISAET